MKGRRFLLSVGVCAIWGLIATIYAQQPEGLTYTGEIVKLDTKNKTITINGPREGLIPEQTQPTGRGGRGSGGRGRGAGGGRRGGGGAGSRASGGSATRPGIDRTDTK